MKARAVLLAGVCAMALAACGKKDAATEEAPVTPAEEAAPADEAAA